MNQSPNLSPDEKLSSKSLFTPNIKDRKNPPPSPATLEMELDGITFPVSTTIVTAPDVILHPKMSRKGLTPDELRKLAKEAVSAVHAPYRYGSTSIGDPKLMEEQVGMLYLIESTEAHLKAFDMLDAFNLVKPINLLHSPALTGTRTNLLKSFTTVTIEDVAASNAWFRGRTSDVDTQYHAKVSPSYLYHCRPLHGRCYISYLPLP
jgi:hypothetical protein